MVHGLVHWALLLWDSIWFSQLCSSGLRVETSKKTTDRVMILEGCSQASHMDHHHSRLRNLGLTLAQIVLARPIRSSTSESEKPYEEWRNGSWELTDASQLVEDILEANSSLSLCEAIKFCLESTCKVSHPTFEPGYLYRCLDRIYTP
jgi:hypothetical protein